MDHASPSILDSTEEPTSNGMAWIGAGILAGMILAVSTAPADAATSPALQDGPWKGPGGFQSRMHDIWNFARTTRSSTSGTRTRFTKKNRGKKSTQTVPQFGIATRKRLQASGGVRRCMGSDFVEKQTDCHASSQQVNLASRVASSLRRLCSCT